MIQIVLVLKKLIYLVRRELKLIRLNMRFLSRRIGFPNIARIIGFGSKRMDRSYNILWSVFEPRLCRFLAISETRSPNESVVDYSCYT